EARIERPIALAADHVFAGEKAGSGNVAKSNGELRCIGRLAPQPEFGVEAFVFERLTPGWGIGSVSDLAISETGFKPIEGLHEDVAARVRPHVAEMHTERSRVRHACSRRLQQPHFPPIVRGHGRASRTNRE